MFIAIVQKTAPKRITEVFECENQPVKGSNLVGVSLFVGGRVEAKTFARETAKRRGVRLLNQKKGGDWMFCD